MHLAVLAARHALPAIYQQREFGLVSEQDFATLLDRRLARIAETKLIEAQPNNGGEKVDARLPPTIPDRRFRRI
jgi:hypothetical protein